MVEESSTVEPNDLSEIVTKLSNLTLETQAVAGESSKYITLTLLQPLADTDMIAACRNPDSRVVRNGDGAIVGPSDHEHLNIEPLSRAWRKVLRTAAVPTKVTFDLTLPTLETGPSSGQKTVSAGKDDSPGPPRAEGDSKTSLSKAEMGSPTNEVYWDTDMPLKGGLAVVSQDVMTLTIALATQMRMRSEAEIRFVLIVPDNARVRPPSRVVELLRKQLAALEKHKAAEKREQ